MGDIKIYQIGMAVEEMKDEVEKPAPLSSKSELNKMMHWLLFEGSHSQAEVEKVFNAYYRDLALSCLIEKFEHTDTCDVNVIGLLIPPCNCGADQANAAIDTIEANIRAKFK